MSQQTKAGWVFALFMLLLVGAAVGFVLAQANRGVGEAYAQPVPVVTPEAPIIVEEPGRVRGFLELLKSSEGRDELLIKLDKLRKAALLLPTIPGETKREDILREAAELEQLMKQYQQMDQKKTKGE